MILKRIYTLLPLFGLQYSMLYFIEIIAMDFEYFIAISWFQGLRLKLVKIDERSDDKLRSKAHFCKIENQKIIITLEAFQMLCRDLYLPFTAVLTVAGLSQRKDLFTFPKFLSFLTRIFNQDLTVSYRERIRYSIVRDRRSRKLYKMYMYWFNSGWKQMFFSKPPERLPVRREYHQRIF